ncbi:cobalamin B12-binding domain-containing protein [Ectothiorhodospiraceae bacterium WFHF3C12]|nr:cobalamin B12-binding domain-containing protein [Ectothiorhodospiraceae bacterium WFHF3C12]
MRVLLAYTNECLDFLPPPPIGLAYVASATRRAGHEVEFVDLLLAEDPIATLRRAIGAFRPDVVGLSVRNIDNVVHQRLQPFMSRLDAQLRAVRGSTPAPIVLGGPAVSIMGAAALQRLDADYAILGEGEEAFPRLLAALAGDAALDGVPGLARRGESAASGPQAYTARFGASSLEHWIDWRDYARQGATWPVQTKRGCPLRCSYCTYAAVEGLGIRKRDPEAVAEEIEAVQGRFSPRCFEFIDSTFNLPPSHAIAVCEAIIRRGLRVNLTTMGVNPLAVSRELLRAMKAAGFRSLMITPEAAHDRMLDGMDKGFDTSHVHHAAKLIRASGMSSMWFFMLGGPGEDAETVEATVRFAEKSLRGPDCLSLFTTGIRILPGTALARQAIADGTLAANADLIEPHFYFSRDIGEAAILDRIDQAKARNPGIVHASEDIGDTSQLRTVNRLLDKLHVAPPYWRFLPRLLALRPAGQRGRSGGRRLSSTAVEARPGE